MAGILNSDFAPGERFDLLDSSLYMESTTKPSADVARGLLAHPLPLVVGTRRLRLAYLEHLEIIYWVTRNRLDTLFAFESASSQEDAMDMAEAIRLRLARVCPSATNVLMTCLSRIDEKCGATADQGTRDTFSKFLGAAHLWPGEHELYFAHMLQRDPNTPPMHMAPLAEEVIHTFRGHDYSKMIEYHVGKPLRRIERDYWPAVLAQPSAAPAMERAALLYMLCLIDTEFSLLRCPAHLVPLTIAYWDELEQHQTGAIRLPPATPQAAFEKYGQVTGTRCALVRLYRRHYLVISIGLVRPRLVTLALPDCLADALILWLGAISSAVYPANEQSMPPEFVTIVTALRQRPRPRHGH